MDRRWWVSGLICSLVVGAAFACTGEDPDITPASSSPDAAPESSVTPPVDAPAPGLGLSVTPATMLVRQGQSIDVTIHSANAVGPVNMTTDVMPNEPSVTVPAMVNLGGGQNDKVVTVGTTAMTPPQHYAVTFYASDGENRTAKATVDVEVVGNAGSVDPFFAHADGGTLSVASAPLYALAVQSDGKIVAAGGTASTFTVVRLTADGDLDATFGSGGRTDVTVNAGGPARALALAANGDILAAGGVGQSVVVRLSSAGVEDMTKRATYSAAGIETYAVALQADGKIVTAGGCATSDRCFSAVRFLATGALDTSFGSGGAVFPSTKLTDAAPNGNDRARAILVDANYIYLAGRAFSFGGSDGQIEIVRLHVADGSLDTTWQGTGAGNYQAPTGFEEEALGIALVGNGSLLQAAGDGYDNLYGPCVHVLQVFVDGGAKDTTLGNSGWQYTWPRNVTTRAVTRRDGGWIFAGTNASDAGSSFVVRYTPATTLDPTFGDAGFTLFDLRAPSPQVNAVAADGKGFILVAGATLGDGFVGRIFP